MNAYCIKHSVVYDFACNYEDCLSKMEKLGLIEFEPTQFGTFIIPLKQIEKNAYEDIDTSELMKILNKDFIDRKNYFTFVENFYGRKNCVNE